MDVRAELRRPFDFTWITRTTAVLVGNLNARDREPIIAKGERDRKPKKGRCVRTRRPLRLAGSCFFSIAGAGRNTNRRDIELELGHERHLASHAG